MRLGGGLILGFFMPMILAALIALMSAEGQAKEQNGARVCGPTIDLNLNAAQIKKECIATSTGTDLQNGNRRKAFNSKYDKRLAVFRGRVDNVTEYDLELRSFEGLWCFVTLTYEPEFANRLQNLPGDTEVKVVFEICGDSISVFGSLSVEGKLIRIE